MFKTLLTTVQKQLADRRRYLRLVAEIDSLSQRDLTDLRADRDEMRFHVWQEIYGSH